MSDLLKKHQNVGKVLSAAFGVDDPVMMDWAKIGFAINEMEQKLDIPYFAVLRPMTSSDVVVGQMVFLVCDMDNGLNIHVKIIHEVLHPDDPWKAYCANDGCRYGLEDAYVIGIEE
jgi:hypothetical protein